MKPTPKDTQSHQIAPDEPGYVEAWAADILAAVGKNEARKLLGDYRAISENKRLNKTDREISKARFQALKKLLK